MLERSRRRAEARGFPSTRLQISFSSFPIRDPRSRAGRRAERAQTPYGSSRTLSAAGNQEEKGGARGGAAGSNAALSRSSTKDAGASVRGGAETESASGAREIATPRSALPGHSVQWEGCALFPGVSAGAPSCFRPVALQISEGSAGTFGFALASSGQNALSAMPASASQAAMRLRVRSLVKGAFLAQMIAFCQAVNPPGVLVFSRST